MCILDKTNTVGELTELRLRVGKPITYSDGIKWHTLYDNNESIICSKDFVEHILEVATGRSMYAYSEQIARGYLTANGGIRIGLTGQGVEENGKLVTYKHINYLAIRIPHEIKGCADKLIEEIGNYNKNLLIISEPGAGKTTLLRDYIRQASNKGNNILLLDERNEVSATYMGKPMLDVGRNTDIVSNTSKTECYKSAVRSMSPDIIATDEIFGKSEIDAISDVVRCGVKVIATVHADSVKSLKNSEYAGLLNIFDKAVILTKEPKVGIIKSVETLRCIDA